MPASDQWYLREPGPQVLPLPSPPPAPPLLLPLVSPPQGPPLRLSVSTAVAVHHCSQPLYLIPSPVVVWVPVMSDLGVVPPMSVPVASIPVVVAATAAEVEGHELPVRGLPSQ